MKNSIHQELKCCRGVCEPERHDCKLIVVTMCLERRLPRISMYQQNLMITRSKVELQNTWDPCNSSNNSSIVGIRKRSRVVTALSIYPVGDAKTPTSIFFSWSN